jgi:hypothetical protein
MNDNISVSNFTYLASLTKTEFAAVTGIMKKYGIKGLLTTVLEIAQFNLNLKETCQAADKARAERVARELGALIERLQGFEELSRGE